MNKPDVPPMAGWVMSPGGRHFYDPMSGWEPLSLSAEAVRLVAIEQFGLTPSRLTLLPGGYLNQTWRIEADGTSWVVRVSRPGRTRAQVEWEQSAARIWQEWVPEVIVAEQITATDLAPGSMPRPVTLFRFRTSDPVHEEVSPARHLAMAGVLAALHQGALATPLSQRPGMHSIDADVSDLFGWQSVRASVLGGSADPAVRSAVTRIDTQLDELRSRFEMLRDAGVLDAYAQAWNDFNPRNRLYRGDRLVGLVDADDACVQPLAWEVGKELFGHRDVSAEAFLNEYHRAGGPVRGDVASLSVFGRVGTLSEIMWMTEYADRVTVVPDAAARIERLARAL